MKIKIGRKSFTVLRRDSDLFNQVPRSNFDYASSVGDGLGSAVITAPALWISRQFPEAPIGVRDKDLELHFDHPLPVLLRHPNQWYGGGTLRMALGLDYAISANSYMEIGRGRGNMPTELVYIPSFQIQPKGTKTELITHYIHETNSGQRRIEASDMIHIRAGIDPHNPKKGLNPLQSLLREIFTDDEAANMTAAILRNMGVPGIIISPENIDDDDFGPAVIDRIKNFFRRTFRGDNQGEPLVLSGRAKVDTLDFDFAKMNIDKLRQIPEERVTAVMGIPAAVVGFGSGLEQTKVGATMKELRELAYENVIIPMQRVFSEEFDRTLLKEFEPNPDQFTVVFDNSIVRVLQEDENRISERITRQYQGGLITRAEGRKTIGLETVETDEVYRLGISDVLLPATPKVEDEESLVGGQADIQQTALSGVQIEAMINILIQVGTGILSAETARVAIQVSFPTIDQDVINRMLAGVVAIDPTEVPLRITPHWVIKALKQSGAEQIQLRDRLIQDAVRLTAIWEDEIEKFFAAMGREIAAAWLELQPTLASRNGQRKQISEEDRSIIDQILLAVTTTGPDYEAYYLRVLRQTHGTIESVIGLGFELADPIERAVVSFGGTRKGLIDFTEQTRTAMFDTIAAAREEGLGVDAIARRIRDEIPGGPWKSAKTRAQAIARTETKYAQNKSAMEIYTNSENVTGIVIFDAQLGDTDENCMAIEAERVAGRVWTIEEANAIPLLDHPNCTRSHAPVVGEPVEA